MKRLFSIAVVFVLFGLSACGEQSVPPASSAVSELMDEGVQSFYTGVVTQAAEGRLTVESDDGESAVFLLTADTQYVFSEDAFLTQGARVRVAYDEKIAAGSSFTAHTVTLLEAAPKETHTFDGVVTDASMNHIRVLNSDGVEVDFPLGPEVVYDVTEGVGPGMKVQVEYIGEPAQGSAEGCVVVRVNEVEPAPPAVLQFSGEVVDVSPQELCVVNADGVEVSFFLNESVVYEPHDGLEPGMRVTVEYLGNIIDGDASGCAVTTVKQAA